MNERTTYAPARAELLGNHTDYNEGLVLAIAINVGTTISGSGRADTQFNLSSEGFPDSWSGWIDQFTPQKEPAPTWPNYVIGVGQALQSAGVALKGADLHISTTIPIGSGLSSSAALEIATALQLLKLNPGKELAPLEIAKAGQWAEHHFSGVKCGLLDQISVLMSKENHATFIDCRSFEVRHLPLGEETEFVIVHSGVNHALDSGDYNERHADCSEAAKLLGVPFLRDVTPGELEERRSLLPERVYRRAVHVVGETARVASAVSCLAHGNMDSFGKLMFESHRSSVENFENSCTEQDFLVNFSAGFDGCKGARLSGGGFGGATIHLLDQEKTAEFSAVIGDAYEKQFGRQPLILKTKACHGAH
ncbi:MAG: galactokinase [Verrucomicrobiota bacterium]